MFDSCTRHQFEYLFPGIAQLAERAIDNREVVGSTPTPWTTLQRASPSGKAPGFHPGIAWVRIPPPFQVAGFSVNEDETRVWLVSVPLNRIELQLSGLSIAFLGEADSMAFGVHVWCVAFAGRFYHPKIELRFITLNTKRTP